MPSIPREVAEHSLDVRPNSKPVKQRLRRFNELKRRAIGEELQKLLAARFIKEMKESHQLATSFITPFGMYCYVTMPFGLRNAGATYQRCMLHVFGDHLGRNVEAYVDDIVVKSRKADDLVADLRIAFDCVRVKGVKLNPKKCVLGGSACSESLEACSWASLSPSEALNPILRKSRPLLGWDQSET